MLQYTGEMIEEAEADARKRNIERWVKTASCIILNKTAKLDGTCYLLPCWTNLTVYQQKFPAIGRLR